jgi:hypothetical protein
MKDLGYETNFIVPNCRSSQLKWAEEHGIKLQHPHHWMYEVAWHQVNFYRPDIIFFTEPLDLDSRFVRMLAHKPKMVLGWRASIIPPGTDWSEFDIILSNLSALRQVALRLGAKTAAHFWPGFERRLAEAVQHEEIKHDVVFCGQWSKGHEKRNKLVAELSEKDEAGELGFSLGVFASGNLSDMPPNVRSRALGARFGVDYYRTIRSAHVAHDARGTELVVPDPITGKSLDLFRGETGTNRMLEVTGVGTALMAEHYDVLTKYFEIGTEIETFRSLDELIEKCRYFKDHPRERDEMARRGHGRCMRDHSMEVRVRELDELMKRYMNRGRLSSGRQSEQSSAIAAAERYIATGQCEQALDILTPFTEDVQITRGLFLTRGKALLALGRLKEASNSLEREVLVYPDNNEARTLLEQNERQLTFHVSPPAFSSQDIIRSLVD